MATTPRKGKPYIWVSWLTGLLAGKQQCVWAAWFKAHYKYDKRIDPDFDLTAWTADHDALVRRHVQVLQDEGRSVTLENENSFHLHGTTAILAGKPDLISRQTGTSLRVSDGKSGEQSPKDWWQVVLYLIAIPLTWKQPDLRIHGEVFYKDGTRIFIEPEEITTPRRAEVFGMIRRMASAEPPPKTPNLSDCRRCDILECAERLHETPPEVVTHEF